MLILSIETSCDETSAAIVKDGTTVLSHVVASSSDLFEKTGGVVPEVAARKQLEYIIPVLDKTLEDAGLDFKDIDDFAVTVGPGLIGSLFVGVNTAKTLSLIYDKLIIPVNHLHGHLYSVFITNYLDDTIQKEKPEFPAVALIVSGGHTDLIYMEENTVSSIKYLGGTRDDAAGEAFDKVARILGIEKYLGGPKLSKTAEQSSKNSSITLPRPMLNEENYDFSFSGLKTAVVRMAEEQKNQRAEGQFNTRHPEEPSDEGSPPAGRTGLSSHFIADISHEFEQAVVDVLVAKTKKAFEEFKPKSLIVAGGVSANKVLRKRLKEKIKSVSLFIPPLSLTGDNAAMIGSAGYFLRESATKDLSKINPNPSLSLERVSNNS